ncbi:MAG TPA: class I SAM-dependent methyltransferase [Flavobacteriales bacterium]|jgi:SAM-dependent methyltransferase|nr:class I SAM-dependent methyltransferase [Flavobacteriales bacterium]
MSVAIPWDVDAPVVNGVHLLSGPSPFEAQYGAVRAKEQRILTDDQVRRLPDGTGLWNADEWTVRAQSAQRLVDDLAQRWSSAHILEVGCGNGWLSGLLHRAGHTVIGIDPFTAELEQAARVFDGPLFARADLLASPLPEQNFHAIVFAASIQYFPDPAAAVRRALELTTPFAGEVHVMDTVLYANAQEAAAAQERSRMYYAELGFAEMATQYHAHQRSAFTGIGRCSVLTAPSRWKRLRGDRSPFTHLVIGG